MANNIKTVLRGENGTEILYSEQTTPWKKTKGLSVVRSSMELIENNSISNAKVCRGENRIKAFTEVNR